MLTTNDNRPKYYSLNNTITGIASAIGPLLGVALLRLDFKVVCFGAASCFMINFVLSRVAMPPIMRQAKSYAVMPAVKRIAKDRPYQIFVLLMMVFWLGASQIDITYPLRVQEIYGSADGVGIMYTVYAVVMAVLQYPLVALASKRFSSRAAVVIGTGIITAALIATPFAADVKSFMAIVACYAVGMILARPNQQNIAVSMADTRALGMYLGVNSTAFAIGKGFGTIIGGASFDMAKKYTLENQHYTFGESDAWLDLWCHTVWQETGNAFSCLAPAVQFGRLGAALTLEALGRRWGWEKTKVWRFFQKNEDAFALHRLPGSYGCLIFNRLYPLDTEASLPTGAEIERIIEKMRICAGNVHIGGSDNARLNKMILWYSRRIIIMRTTDYAEQVSKNRVALSSPIIRAYISLCWNCQNCIYDCRGVSSRLRRIDANHIRGLCAYAVFFLNSRNRKGEST